ncbi:molybdate ABC transporter substrate-binding protein [Sporosarcina luteola]|uniref:molybdate ABC transporter substrate-binding protein n=1 Tax=Bacillales TaxID=1385 RepID=UPI00203BAFE4|nr:MULTISPECIES: molybdate ABC transporter substrate-binding protein [Bacillales]MCM3637591.1 molybdate ABC transporter substrate-binding protein [Sporosarcina luteola]
MKKFIKTMLLLAIAAIPLGCANKGEEGMEKKEIAISAAASLTDALTELKNVYEDEHDDVFITLNFGSSRKLATQIEQGAPADIFLSASSDDMERLKEQGLINESTIVDFTENSLVLITNNVVQNPVSSYEQLGTDKSDHISMGEPDTVPAGRYAKEVLENLQLWTPLQDKLVMGSDVRQVLTHVEMGNADYGIVYASDAWTSDKVTVVAVADPTWHSNIIYPGAVVSDSDHPSESQEFLELLSGEKGRAVLQKYGFK